MPEIIRVLGREILDSRGNPTVEAEVLLADGSSLDRTRSAPLDYDCGFRTHIRQLIPALEEMLDTGLIAISDVEAIRLQRASPDPKV